MFCAAAVNRMSLAFSGFQQTGISTLFFESNTGIEKRAALFGKSFHIESVPFSDNSGCERCGRNRQINNQIKDHPGCSVIFEVPGLLRKCHRRKPVSGKFRPTAWQSAAPYYRLRIAASSE